MQRRRAFVPRKRKGGRSFVGRQDGETVSLQSDTFVAVNLHVGYSEVSTHCLIRALCIWRSSSALRCASSASAKGPHIKGGHMHCACCNTLCTAQYDTLALLRCAFGAMR